jgi:hypothetical protein
MTIAATAEIPRQVNDPEFNGVIAGGIAGEERCFSRESPGLLKCPIPSADIGDSVVRGLQTGNAGMRVGLPPVPLRLGREGWTPGKN